MHVLMLFLYFRLVGHGGSQHPERQRCTATLGQFGRECIVPRPA
jgi:hypothetical protein